MISIVVPAYNEQDGIALLYERVTKVAAGWHDDYEIVIVDDGSQDGTLQILSGLAVDDRRVKVLSFTRHFGHQAAVTAGLVHASGDIVAVMDADLQDAPEELDRFLRKCREGYDVGYGIRVNRKESVLQRAAYHGYYYVLRFLANIDIPLDAGDFCVISRKALDGVINFSYKPLRILGLTGMAVGALALTGAAVFFLQYVTNTTVFGYNLGTLQDGRR